MVAAGNPEDLTESRDVDRHARRPGLAMTAKARQCGTDSPASKTQGIRDEGVPAPKEKAGQRPALPFRVFCVFRG
jgi:hypothetical protein